MSSQGDKFLRGCNRIFYLIFLVLLVWMVLILPAQANSMGPEFRSGEGSLQRISDTLWILKQDSNDLVLEFSSFELEAEHTLQIEPASSSATTHIKFSDNDPIEINGTITTTGNLKLSATKIRHKGKLIASGGSIELSADSVVLDGGGVDVSHESQPGGTIKIDAKRWVSLGGRVNASGSIGGRVEVGTGGLNIAGSVLAMGSDGPGGSIDLKVRLKSWENTSAYLDVSGTTGGSIRHITDQQITTSGKYLALGEDGIGGHIDITAPALKFLSTQINASGQTGGGQIRLGGELQGGKNLDIDELPNAELLAMTDGTRITADTLGLEGSGGTIIVWSERKTTVLGTLSARPGKDSGKGGFVETSSTDRLRFAGKTFTGRGDRSGEFLMDPKNGTIDDSSVINQQAIIIGDGYDSLNIGSQTLTDIDQFGYSLSLDGLRLAVGANFDGGSGGTCTTKCGAVYLYTFTDNSFGRGSLQAIIGDGYTGDKNINLTLENNDEFGRSVSLDGTRLAVGAIGEDGSSGTCKSECGAVYLYTFTDTEFSNNGSATDGTGALQAIIGDGYTGGKNVNLTLVNGDRFGQSVSLDGPRLAVGAHGDDGSSGTCTGSCGAVYLYTFTDLAFSNNGDATDGTGALQAIIGDGYTGGKNVSVTLENADQIGISVSLDGTRLAIGAPGDDGSNGTCTSDCGAVYLYTFTDSAFTGGDLKAVIGDGYNIRSKDINITLGNNDAFGTSVSLDNTRLAIGARWDDGSSGTCTSDCGGVYLYTFTDLEFSNDGNATDGSGALQAIIGDGYTGGKNVGITLDNSDFFGNSVSLDGMRLAIGARGDDGSNGTCTISCGAVYLYTFTDKVFSGGGLEFIIGDGYTGGKNVSVTLDNSDLFGTSVSLDGTRLAVGVRGDDGSSGTCTGSCGAVYLYTFTNASFGSGTLEAIIGDGYTGGKNVSVTLGTSDFFGNSVSLDGTRLAVGAFTDDGSSGTCTDDCGAVYLYTFTDMEFSNNGSATDGTGALQAIIGDGYTGGKNINLSLNNDDFFGQSLSLDGTRLAVGALRDDGSSGTCTGDCGAVYLYTFTDTAFSNNGNATDGTGALQAIIGDGYSGGKNISLTLDNSDQFGTSVSLDGTRLAVGAIRDGGSSGTCTSNCGAVYLYTFTDTAFSNNGNATDGTGALQAIIGDGYTGGKNVSLTLDNSDQFGISVSLDGTRLAVGADLDDGSSGTCTLQCGAVYLYTFTDTAFSNNGNATDGTGALQAIIGDGYTGGKNVNLTLEDSDQFGSSVSLDGLILSVGARLEDGSNGNCTSACGTAFLYQFGDTNFSPPDNSVDEFIFAERAGLNLTLSSRTLEDLLSIPNNVTLQVNNDLTVSSAVTVDNSSGSGGDLTLQAGRSILLNANITTDNGDLSLIANELLVNGVQDAHRDPGDAVFTMQSGTTIDTGSGSLDIELRDGTGKTNTGCGDITLETIQAGAVTVDLACNASSLNVNKPISGTTIDLYSDDDIVFAADGDITASGAVTVTADSDANSDAGSGGALTMANGTEINAGSSTVTLSADENVILDSVLTNTSDFPAVNINSTSGSILDVGTIGTNVTATNSGFAASTGIDLGASGNFIEGNVFVLDFSGVTGSDFFNNTGTDVEFDAATSNGSESTTAVNLGVSLDQVNGTTTVDYAVTGGTATGSGTDYTLADGTLTFTPGDTSENIAVTINNDTLDEVNQTIEVTLSNPSNADLGTNTVHTYTINDNDGEPTVAFDANSSNASESTTAVNLPVSLSTASGKTITVDYDVTGGSATGSGTDYTFASGTLTFNPLDTSENIAITVVNDILDEVNETIQVTLSSPSNATLGTNTVHTYTINDNDSAPSVAFNAISSNASESTTIVNLPVSLSAVSGKTVTVQYNVTGGNATGSGTDFTLTSGSLTFVAGDTSENVTITVNNDALDESNETIEVTLSSPSNATLGSNTIHTYTLNDDDSQPTVAFDAISSNASESITGVNLPVSLSAASGKTVTVQYSVTGGSATGSGTDFTLASGTLTFNPLDTTVNIAITANNDALDESNETIEVTLSSPSNATLGTNTVHTYTINDDDGAPTVAFDATTSNASESTTGVNLPVSLSVASGKTVTVQYTVTGGNASGSGTDFILVNGTLTFNPLDSSENIVFTVINDALDEIDETIQVTLSSPSNATLGTNTIHTYTINDDDGAPTVDFDATSSNGSEVLTSVNLAVSLSTASGNTVTVQYAVSGGTATANGTDYSLSSGTLTFTPGDTSENVAITVSNDALDENNETIEVTLSSPSNATLGSNTIHTYTINDDDSAPTVAFNASSSNASESVTSANLSASLSTASSKTVTVEYSVTSGSATGGGTDYTLLGSGTLTFSAGDTLENVGLTIINDSLDENNETVSVTLSNPVNATLSVPSQHIYTINDDDSPPTVAFDAIASNQGESVSSVNLPVSLSTQSSKTVTVGYSVTGGTATGSGTDYTLSSGTLTFSSGDTSENINITVINDSLDEVNETVVVTLSSPSNASLGTNTVHTYTINDDDGAPTVAFTAISSNASESVTSVNIPVSLSNQSSQTITVDYSVTGGNATGSGTDYTLTNGTLTFVPNDTSENIAFTVVNDILDEVNETVEVTLSNPSNVTLGTNTVHTYTINDEDSPPTVAFDSGSSNASESTTSVNLAVSLSTQSSKTVTVDYAVTAGNATGSGTDYTLLGSGTLTFSSGDTSENVGLTINNDTLDEVNETVTITLSNPANASLTVPEAHTYTINDDDSAPSVAFDATASNGNESVTSINLAVSLSASSAKTATVQYAVTGGTATGSGTDYTLASGTLTFVPGDTSENITVSVINDALDESNETVVLTLSNPSNASLGTNTTHTYTINDDDGSPTVSFELSESNAGEEFSPAELTVNLSNVSSQEITVDYVATVNGTAEDGVDFSFQEQIQTMIFSAGDTSKDILIDITDDDIGEPNETIEVTLQNPNNADLGTITTHTYTIVDNDSVPEVSFDSANSSGDESSTTVNIPVSLRNNLEDLTTSGNTIEVTYFIGGTATSDGDFTDSNSGTLTFDPGDSTKNIELTVIDDGTVEDDETIVVTLLAPPANLAQLGDSIVHTYTIENNDVPTVAFDATSSSGVESVGAVQIPVSLSESFQGQAQVNYTVVGGTATGSGTDFTLANGTLTFSPGTTTQNIILTVVDDSTEELDETIIIALSGPVKATLGTNTVHTFTIEDDDFQTVGFDVASSSGKESVSPATFTVELASASIRTVEVDYTVTAGTATAVDDYTLANGTLTFDPGETSMSFDASIVDDALDEGDEAFVITLSNPVDGIPGISQHTHTIIDDDGLTLNVDPLARLSFSGPVGTGPYVPTPQSYTLKNRGKSTISYSVSSAQTWSQLSDTSGSLEPGTDALVDITINAGQANGFPVGLSSSEITFTNTTNSEGNTERFMDLLVANQDGSIAVFPESDSFSLGPLSGPFSPESFIYTIINTGGSEFDYTITNSEEWVEIEVDGEVLKNLDTAADIADPHPPLLPGESRTFTIRLTDDADVLGLGLHTNTVTFQNTTNGNGSTSRDVNLLVDPLVITPQSELSASGEEGGPFFPAGLSYTLTNEGVTPVSYEVTNTEDWVTIEEATGTLDPGENAMVHVSIDAQANTLIPGAFSDTVVFTNTTTSGVFNKSVFITVLSETSDVSFQDSGQRLGDAFSLGLDLGDSDNDGQVDFAFVANGSSQPNAVWLNDGFGNLSDSGQTLGSATSRDVALGDVDGDGDLDAFVVNDGANKVWLNDGSETFSSGSSLGDSNSHAVQLADLNGDTHLDAFVANTGQNKVWLNNGNNTGTFTLGQSLGSSTSRGVSLLDVDGDGDVDAFVANGNNEPNKVWLNDGTGSFVDSQQSLGSFNSQDVAMSDLNGDGHSDAFVVNGFANGLDQPDKVWLNDGLGNFSGSGLNLGTSDSKAVALGELDDNSSTDAFVGNLDEPDLVWLNDASGLGLFSQSGQGLGNTFSNDVKLGDADGDGDLDAFVVNGSPNRLYMNLKQGTDPHVILVTNGPSGSPNPVSSGGTVNLTVSAEDSLEHDLSYAWTSDCSALGNDNGSFDDTSNQFSNWTAPANETDITQSCMVSVTVTDGQGPTKTVHFDQKVSPASLGLIFIDSGQNLGLSISNATALGDIDGDGDLDAFVANTLISNVGANTVWLNDGDGDFSDSGQALGNLDSRDVALGDSDNDSTVDFAFVANASPNKVYGNDGSGTFSETQSLGDEASNAISLGDVDGDTDLDVFVANSGANTVWLNNGSDSFSDSNQELGEGISLDVALGDVDDDGDLDAFIANAGANIVWLNNGSGTFTDSGQELGTSSSKSVVLEDFDGDGDLDVFVGNSGPDKVWLNDGAGNFTDSLQLLGTTSTGEVVAGKINADDIVDVFATSDQFREFSTVWLGNGDGTFIASERGVGDQASNGVALGDVDDDGDLDAFIANGIFSRANKLWFNISGDVDPEFVVITGGPSGSPNPIASEGIVAMTVQALDEDGNDDNLTYSWSGFCATIPGDGSFNNALIQSPTWTSPENNSASQAECRIEVTVQNDTGQVATGFFTQLVLPAVEISPVIGPISDELTQPNLVYVGPLPKVTGTAPITFSFDDSFAPPNGMTINTTTGQVTWDAPDPDGTQIQIVIRATNNEGFDTESWILTVTSDVIAPVIITPLLLGLNPSPDSLDTTADIEGLPVTTVKTLPDVPYEGPILEFTGVKPVTWKLISGPFGMTIDETTGVVSWPQPVLTGSGGGVQGVDGTVTVEASNSEGSDRVTWTIEVTSNIDTLVMSTIPDGTIESGEDYSASSNILEGAQPFDCFMSQAPSGMTADFIKSLGFNGGCFVTWINPTLGAEANPNQLNASDAASNQGDTSWSLTVSGATAPSLNTVSDQNIDEGIPYTEALSLSAGTLPVNWVLEQNPAGVLIDNEQGIVTWATPVEGTHTVRVRAENKSDNSLSDSEEWKLTVGDLPKTTTPVEHVLIVTQPPRGFPNPAPSGGTVGVKVVAKDSFNHAIAYSWSASCPTLTESGSFAKANAKETTWTAPVITTGPVSCTLTATVDDGQGNPPISAQYKQGITAPGAEPVLSLNQPEFKPACFTKFCNQSKTQFSITNNTAIVMEIVVRSSQSWLNIDQNVIKTDHVPELDIPVSHDVALPQVSEVPVTLDPGQTATFTAQVNTDIAALDEGAEEAVITFEDSEGNPLATFDILLTVLADPFAIPRSQRVISPYWQADGATYTFIAVSHPGLQEIAANVGVVINAVQSDLAPFGAPVEFTVSANSTKRVFIVATNNPVINESTIPDGAFIVGTTSGKHGQLVIGPKATDPTTDTGSGYPDITMLNFWGAVVVQATSTGFAMEFIGDTHDSGAVNLPVASGVN